MVILLLLAALARGGEVAVVLGGELRPYQEALEGFREAYNGDFALLKVGDRLPAGTRVVLAIGGKAATLPLPDGVRLVYCLSPGVLLSASAARVAMVPRPSDLLARIRKRQPSLRRLATIAGSPSYRPYLVDLAAAAKAEDLELVIETAASPREVPAKLRLLLGRADALWLPPDPLVLDRGSLEALRLFSWDNDVPLYMSSPGLAERGAAASFHVPYRAFGRAAAQAVRDTLQGRARARYYADDVEEVVNEEAAREAGLGRP